MTPAGPITLRFALFGLQKCSSCFTAELPMILLYPEPPGLETLEPSGDHVRVILGPFEDLQIEVRIDGMYVNDKEAEVALDLPDIPDTDETSPPLDEAAPPLLPATLTIQGAGWDITASFAASLCSDLNWFHVCE
jgi:hypothetical protein